MTVETGHRQESVVCGNKTPDIKHSNVKKTSRPCIRNVNEVPDTKPRKTKLANFAEPGLARLHLLKDSEREFHERRD